VGASALISSADERTLQEDTMELFNLSRASDRHDQDEDGDFVVELTVEELAVVGGGTGDGEANSEKIAR
jgi:hypothetical protein